MEVALSSCSKGKGSEGTETERLIYKVERYDVLGINQEQHMYYKLQPIFRALIIITDDHTSEKNTERVVHLVRTNITSELSAPITFESIEPKFEQNQSFEHGNNNIVSTTLSVAIDFIIALDSCEQSVFPER